MIWYVIGAVVAFDVAFVMGCAWRAQHSVSVETFDEAMRQSERAVEMIRAGRRREAVLRKMLAQARQPKITILPCANEPDAIDWSVLGV